MNLYEISTEYRAAMEELQEMDLDEDTYRDTLDSMSGGIEDKAIAIAAVIKNMNLKATAIDSVIKDLNKKSVSIELKRSSLLAYLKFNMERCEIKTINDPIHMIKISMNPPSVVIDCADQIPIEFMVTPPTPIAPPARPDKKAIIKAGGCEGASVVRNTRISIK